MHIPHTHQKSNQFIEAVIHTQGNPPQKWVLSRNQLSLHQMTRPTPRGASRLVQQCLPGPWTPDVLRLGVVGVRGSMVIHTATTMHDNEYTPHPVLAL